MKVEIRKAFFGGGWLWTCPVCHYGADIPWEESDEWRTAHEESWEHINRHRVVGKRLEWIPLRFAR